VDLSAEPYGSFRLIFDSAPIGRPRAPGMIGNAYLALSELLIKQLI
jgi:hypothetical protein